MLVVCPRDELGKSECACDSSGDGRESGALPVYGSIFAHCSRSLIEGHGTLLSCSTRDRCMFLGDQVNSNHYGGITLRGVNFTSTVHADGCLI